MPDRATVEAATPKCPVCGECMEWLHVTGVWVCAAHPKSTITGPALVAGQRQFQAA